MASTSPLSPTFYGHIASTKDALLLFEACLRGTLKHIARRPLDWEKDSLSKSGNIFIFNKDSSGIKHWRDRVPWSPNRRLRDFIIYRELQRPFLPDETRTIKRARKSADSSKQETFRGSNHALSGGYTLPVTSSTFDSLHANLLDEKTRNSLIGSLEDSYDFKEGGLVRKSVYVTVGGALYGLVSYYTIADVISKKLSTPSEDPRFRIKIRPDLLTSKFHEPIDEADNIEGLPDPFSVSSGAQFASENFFPRPTNFFHLNINLPDDQHSTVNTLLSFDNMPLIPGGTWPGNLESPVYLKDNLPSVHNQHVTAGATFSDSPLLIPDDTLLGNFDFPVNFGNFLPLYRDATALPGIPRNISAVLPLGHTISSNTDRISMMNHFTNSAYLEEKQSKLRLRTERLRAKRACTQCRKKKIRCNRKGAEECVPSRPRLRFLPIHSYAG